ncbi:MAG: hypothetical protein U9O86_06060 [Campylobacterota bacterium]|nr:hypothetical protein [Campylobacterota bacterium]
MDVRNDKANFKLFRAKIDVKGNSIKAGLTYQEDKYGAALKNGKRTDT